MIFIRYPTVWIYSTGDELENNKNPCHNCIRDTNSLMIKQLLEQDNYKGSVFNGGVIRDKYVIFNICIL
jgi:molybdopterin biosynthesis enzyme